MASLNKVGGLGLVAKLNEQENALRRSERKFALAFKAAADVIAISRLSDGELIDFNDSFTRVLGYTRDEAVGRTTLQLGLWPSNGDRLMLLRRLEAEGVVRNQETALRMKNGDIRVGQLSVETVEYEGEICVVSSWHDVTERKAAEVKLRRQNEYLSSLHETALALLERQDMNDLLESILRRAGNLVGTPHAYIYLADYSTQTLRLTIGAGMYAGNDGDCLQFGEGMAGKVLISGKPLSINNYAQWEGRSPNVRNDRLHSVVGVPLLAAGKAVGVLGVSNPEATEEFGPQEIDLLCRFGELASIALDNAYLHQALHDELVQRKAVEQELRYINAHDSLTKLRNRASFEEELKRQATDSSAIIICDVDGLKLINDSMGHQQGDALLVAAADIIRQAAPPHAFAARIGGDEFAIILLVQADTQAELVCQTIRQLAEDRKQQNPHLPLSISTGYAVSLSDNKSMAQLFKEADDSMYREKLHRSQSVRSAIVNALLKALEARDFITEGHGERMQSLVVDLGAAAGLSKRTLGELRLIAQFHDIGKVGIPDRILFKQGPLTEDEYSEMKRHCEIGHRIALSTPDLAPIAKYILHHHEWWDGQGYPIGLKGVQIPLECRILAIADAYDAMTSNRPYRQAMQHKQAIAELQRCSGKQFDPWLVAIFESCNGFVEEKSV